MNKESRLTTAVASGARPHRRARWRRTLATPSAERNRTVLRSDPFVSLALSLPHSHCHSQYLPSLQCETNDYCTDRLTSGCSRAPHGKVLNTTEVDSATEKLRKRGTFTTAFRTKGLSYQRAAIARARWIPDIHSNPYPYSKQGDTFNSARCCIRRTQRRSRS